MKKRVTHSYILTTWRGRLLSEEFDGHSTDRYYESIDGYESICEKVRTTIKPSKRTITCKKCRKIRGYNKLEEK